MNTLRQAVQEYLTMRRSLGYKLQGAGKKLLDFATFMEHAHSDDRDHLFRRIATTRSERSRPAWRGV
jgi:hypothetical protein